jgi:ATP-dependent Lon protease
MLPSRNRSDLEEVPAQAKSQLEFIFLDDVEQALQGALDLVHVEQLEELHEKT